jgi:hypothetical protein
VRKLITLTLASTAIIAVACSKQAPDTAMSADLKADLKLASTTQDIRINPDELTPTSKPAPATKIKKASSGPKVVRSPKPTVLASATPTEAADVPTEIPEVQAMAPAPAPSPEPSPADAPPLARPSVIPASNAGGQTANAGSGRGDSGMGGGSVWGGIFGAVIRGGVVGDDDHCDPRSMPGRRRPSATDVYGGGIAGGGMRGVPSGIGGRRRF